MGPFEDIAVDASGLVSLVEIRRPPNNYFDVGLIRQLADALEALDEDEGCRAVVLAAQGRAELSARAPTTATAAGWMLPAGDRASRYSP